MECCWSSASLSVHGYVRFHIIVDNCILAMLLRGRSTTGIFGIPVSDNVTIDRGPSFFTCQASWQGPEEGEIAAWLLS